MNYKEYKKAIIKAKSDEKLLRDMLRFLQSGKVNDLSKKELLRLIDLIISFLHLIFENKRLNKVSKETKIRELLEKPINDDYLFNLIEDIDFNSNSDYIIGLYNLLTDNNYIYNGIGLKIVIAKYLSSLEDINNLKVFKLSNFKLNDEFKFLTFKNGKTLNYTKLYFNNEYNLIIFNTLKNDNIVSVVLYDKTKINDIENIVQSGVITYDKDFKHIEDLDSYKYTYYDKEEQYLENKERLEDIFNYRFNTKIYNIKLTYEDIINNFFKDIYYNDLFYAIYKEIIAYEKANDNFKSNDLELLKTTLNDFDNFNYKNLYKKARLKDIKINIKDNKVNRDYKNDLSKKMINHDLKGLKNRYDIKQYHLEHIIKDLI